MTEFFSSSTFFSVSLTLIAFAFASAFQKRWKLALFNPILISAALIMGALALLDVPNSVYQEGCRVLSYLLTPATICLAISFYEQFQGLKKHLTAIVIGVLAGTVCSLGSIYFLCRLFDLTNVLTYSLLPKSVTTAIGVALTEEMGGIAAITTAAIVVTGIFGNVAGSFLCRIFGIRSEIAQGVAFGTSAHVVGTARAVQISELTGAVSSLSLTVAGIVTAVLMSFLAQFI